MNFKSLDRGELIAAVGGIVLGVSVFLAWYSLSNVHAALNSCKGPNSTCTGWHALLVLRYILLVTAAAPLILTWIVIRGHALAWPRGELTAIISLLALTLTVFRGVIDKPGAPRSEIHVTYGWWIALAAGFLILGGSLFRSQESAERSKPPGVL